MELIEQLINALSQPTYEKAYEKAKSNGTCILCKQPAACFQTASTKFEYDISAICEDCQRHYFN